MRQRGSNARWQPGRQRLRWFCRPRWFRQDIPPCRRRLRASLCRRPPGRTPSRAADRGPGFGVMWRGFRGQPAATGSSFAQLQMKQHGGQAGSAPHCRQTPQISHRGTAGGHPQPIQARAGRRGARTRPSHMLPRRVHRGTAPTSAQQREDNSIIKRRGGHGCSGTHVCAVQGSAGCSRGSD